MSSFKDSILNKARGLADQAGKVARDATAAVQGAVANAEPRATVNAALGKAKALTETGVTAALDKAKTLSETGSAALDKAKALTGIGTTAHDKDKEKKNNR